MTSNWINKLKIKKNMYLNIENVSDKEYVYLPNFSHGLKWENTKVISSSSEIKTSSNEGIFKNYSEKIDDNSFNLICNSFKNRTKPLSLPLFELVKQDGTNVNYWSVVEGLQKGVTIYTNRIISIYINIILYILPNSQYSPLDLSIYCNNKLLKTFVDYTKFDKFYITYPTSFYGIVLSGSFMYAEPINGKCTIKVVQQHEHIQANMIMTNNQLAITYIDAYDEVSTENDIHLIAYEEK